MECVVGVGGWRVPQSGALSVDRHKRAPFSYAAAV